MSFHFFPIGKKAIYVLYNEICATIELVKRLESPWWKSSKSR